MTNEHLSKANEIHKKIIETEKMIKDLQNGYMNSINAVSFRGEKEDSSCVTFGQGDELHALIITYFRQKLSELQQEFERL